MLLSITERILLLNVLPLAEGDFLFLRAVRTLKESLGFSEDEAAEIGLKRDGVSVTWNSDQHPMKDIEIGPVVAAYLSKAITAAPVLKEEHFEVYARFVQHEGG